MVVINNILLYTGLQVISHRGLETLHPNACFLDPLGVHLQPFVQMTATMKTTHQGMGTVTLAMALHYLCVSIQTYPSFYD
jgi:hypothetical protein